MSNENITQDAILDKALGMIDEKGVLLAYDYLLENKSRINKASSQYYNYLYCIAALCNKKEEALAFLEEAIIQNEYWYRTEVFEDEDLDLIRNEPRYKHCFKISEERFIIAQSHSKSIITWKQKSSDNIIYALHGNQQSIENSKDKWEYLNGEEYQVEYIQSSEVDSYGIYRWENESSGVSELIAAINTIPWKDYNRQILCGFSSGCNVILNTLLKYEFACSAVILQSPWIPTIKGNLQSIVDKIEQRNIKVLLICGKDDEDCYPLSMKLVKSFENRNIEFTKVFIDGLKHEFSNDYKSIVSNFLKSL